ncbi:hypothetical protein FACS189475_10210 [Betaproteobacteria bacterium]|nr:hypothetical protein FACS189475_10210 [Betaproteobacteria bacterium]
MNACQLAEHEKQESAHIFQQQEDGQQNKGAEQPAQNDHYGEWHFGRRKIAEGQTVEQVNLGNRRDDQGSHALARNRPRQRRDEPDDDIETNNTSEYVKHC